VVKPDGMAAVIFAHTATAAWRALIHTMIASEWVVTTSWPVRSEFSARSRAIGRPSLASSVCLVCRPRQLADVGYFDDVRSALESRVRSRLEEFWQAGISGADFFISAIGPAIEVFGQFREVVKLSGEVVSVDELLVMTQQIVADFTLTHLLERSAVGVIDEISRFYIFWRWAFGRAPVPADDAYKLAHAFGVELDRVAGRRGLVRKTGDVVTLLGPREREPLLDKGVEVESGDPYIDVLHRSLLLWDAGRRNELAQLLARYQVDSDPAFWAMAQTLGELLAEDDPERVLAQGFTGARQPLADSASRQRPGTQLRIEV
jgi:putative DNA methylase